MSEVKKVTMPSFNIEGLEEMEVEVICAALAMATLPRIKIQLKGEGFDVPLNRIQEYIDQLWEDLHEQRA